MEQNITYKDFIQNILNTRGRFGIPKGEYKERHHILPKCIGGTNNKDNLIDLYAREHYIAHKLLALENKDNRSIVLAWHRVHKSKFKGNIISEEDYETLKNELSRHISNLMSSIERSDEWRKNIGIANSKRIITDEMRNKISKSHKERFNKKEEIRLLNLLSSINRDEFENYYRYHNGTDTIKWCKEKFSDFYGRDYKYLLDYWNIKRRSTIETNNIKISKMRENYGVINNFQRKEIKDKCKQIKKDKYGDEWYSNQDKAKETKLKKYSTLYMHNLDKCRNLETGEIIDE